MSKVQAKIDYYRSRIKKLEGSDLLSTDPWIVSSAVVKIEAYTSFIEELIDIQDSLKYEDEDFDY